MRFERDSLRLPLKLSVGLHAVVVAAQAAKCAPLMHLPRHPLPRMVAAVHAHPAAVFVPGPHHRLPQSQQPSTLPQAHS